MDTNYFLFKFWFIFLRHFKLLSFLIRLLYPIRSRCYNFIISQQFHEIVHLVNEEGYIVKYNGEKISFVESDVWTPQEYNQTLQAWGNKELCVAEDVFPKMIKDENGMYSLYVYRAWYNKLDYRMLITELNAYSIDNLFGIDLSKTLVGKYIKSSEMSKNYVDNYSDQSYTILKYYGLSVFKDQKEKNTELYQKLINDKGILSAFKIMEENISFPYIKKTIKPTTYDYFNKQIFKAVNSEEYKALAKELSGL